MRFKYSLTLVACVLVRLHYGEALGQGSPPLTAVQERCIAEIKARTAAMVAKDWPQLELIAERYISICGTVFGASDLSMAYEAKATALIRLQRLPEASKLWPRALRRTTEFWLPLETSYGTH